MPAELTVRELSHWYDSKASKALNRISIEFSSEYINVLLGQNGSGKSSLLRCLGGMQIWREGDVLHKGVSRAFDHRGFNQDLIMISEDLTLPLFPLEEVAEIYARIWHAFDRTRFARVLDFGEIPAGKSYLQLSRGQRILAQFALGLATGCSTVLVDEVTAALDPYIRRRVGDELVEFQRAKGATVVIATNVATEFPDVDVRAILLKNGEIFMEGLLSELGREFVKIKVPVSRVNEAKGLVPVARESRDIEIMVGRRGSLHENTLFEIDTRQVTLEEIFNFLTERGQK